MRQVDRSRVAEPASLVGPTSPAATERARAEQHYLATPDEAFDFAVYKRQDVADALNSLFKGKCAYCESSIQAVQPTDIEHFRPKGRIAECPDHPGYWWLAASWSNLLASCIDCNRRRYQEVQQLDHDRLTQDPNWIFNLGKGDLFPILGTAHARSEADDHDAEDAALIDPTRRNPSMHLVWLEQDGLSLVGPREQDGRQDPYGWHTYRVFGLNRQGLVEQRTARMLEIRGRFAFVEEMLDLAVQLPEPHSSRQIESVSVELGRLELLADEGQPYSAMVRSLLDAELARLENKFGALTPL